MYLCSIKKEWVQYKNYKDTIFNKVDTGHTEFNSTDKTKQMFKKQNLQYILFSLKNS